MIDGAAGPPLVYWLDPQRRIVRVSEGWAPFAEANQAPELARPELIGRSLWELVRGAETRALYELIFEKVDADGRPARLPFRCDAPDERRFLELEIAPRAGGGHVVSSRTLRCEPREPVALLDAAAPRTDELLLMCSLCKRLEVAAAGAPPRWLEVEEAIRTLDLFGRLALPQLSHGVCPDCESRARTMLGLPPET
jgi:hypothetical protein